ncbi:MAG TPA: lipopolysaccharide assembly protein LapB, partial [Burkholderiaceae bacterium]|nr:lipopolysaccharide assembly protein LapB [Burkholderiaceae bacterium]
WAAARIDARDAIRASSRLPDSYFKGLNFLLNEQPDKAIDAFIDVVKLDPETVELHFALGNLFRRRGETDRAIRVHQNLAERRDIEPRQREHALYELGNDFLRAGLLDRAEDVFNRLEGSSYAAAALRHRLEIAQMVRDWPTAIDLAERLQQQPGQADARPAIAHFRCELAQQALSAAGAPAAPPGAEDRWQRARRELERAIEVEPAHPRAWLLLGELGRRQQDDRAAVDAWSQLARLSPAHLALIGDAWIDAHQRLGRLDEGIAQLEAILVEHPSVDALRAVARGKAQRDGLPSAIEWLQAQLARAPSLLGLEQLLELRRELRGGEHDADAALTGSMIARQASRLSRYVCSHCGFKARQFYWQCPGCNRWDSYAPRRTEEIDGR